MNSNNIYKACHTKKMRPVCNHANYADGRCVLVGRNWHMSYPGHTRRYAKTMPKTLLKGVYTYCGKANHQRSLLNRGNTHRWSNNRDRNGETLCAKPSRKKMKFKYNHYNFLRVKVK